MYRTKGLVSKPSCDGSSAACLLYKPGAYTERSARNIPYADYTQCLWRIGLRGTNTSRCICSVWWREGRAGMHCIGKAYTGMNISLLSFCLVNIQYYWHGLNIWLEWIVQKTLIA